MQRSRLLLPRRLSAKLSSMFRFLRQQFFLLKPSPVFLLLWCEVKLDFPGLLWQFASSWRVWKEKVGRRAWPGEFSGGNNVLKINLKIHPEKCLGNQMINSTRFYIFLRRLMILTRPAWIKFTDSWKFLWKWNTNLGVIDPFEER